MPTVYYKRMSEFGAPRSIDVCSLTVIDIKNAIGSQMGLLSTYYGTLRLVESQTVLLTDTDIVTENSTVEVVQHPINREVPFAFYTSSACVIDGDNAEGPRVRMTCGHGITPENLFLSALCCLWKAQTNLWCLACASPYHMSQVFERASLSIDEKIFLSRKINRNVISEDDNIRECPSCSSLCERSNISNNQVTCAYCLTSFCWKCNQPWIGSHACNKAEANRILRSCELITMAYSDIPNVPTVRSCPKCHVLLQHTGGCKTMACPAPCGYVFCFSCLKSHNGSDLNCGSYGEKCDVAPRQCII